MRLQDAEAILNGHSLLIDRFTGNPATLMCFESGDKQLDGTHIIDRKFSLDLPEQRSLLRLQMRWAWRQP
jgi:hypothetical protein